MVPYTVAIVARHHEGHLGGTVQHPLWRHGGQVGSRRSTQTCQIPQRIRGWVYTELESDLYLGRDLETRARLSPGVSWPNTYLPSPRVSAWWAKWEAWGTPRGAHTVVLQVSLFSPIPSFLVRQYYFSQVYYILPLFFSEVLPLYLIFKVCHPVIQMTPYYPTQSSGNCLLVSCHFCLSVSFITTNVYCDTTK